MFFSEVIYKSLLIKKWKQNSCKIGAERWIIGSQITVLYTVPNLTAYHNDQEKQTGIDEDKEARQNQSQDLYGFQHEAGLKVEITLDTKLTSRQV